MMIYQWYNVKSHHIHKSKSGSVGKDQIYIKLSWKEKNTKSQVFRDQRIKPEDFRSVSRLKIRSWGVCVMWCSWCHQQAISKTHRFPSISSAKNFTHQNHSEAAPVVKLEPTRSFESFRPTKIMVHLRNALFSLALRILTPPMETPDPPNDTPGALKQVVLTPHDIPWSLRVDGLWHPFRKPCNPHWISNGLVFLLEDFLVWARDLHVWIGVVAKTTGHFSGRRDEKPVWTCGISDPPAKNRQQVGFLRCISGT